MPELKTSAIHPGDLYVLDCCCEDDTIDAGTSVVLRLYGDRSIIHDCVANTPVAIGPYPWRQSIGERMMSYADQIIAELPASRRGELAACSLIHMHHIRVSTSEYLACAAISDIVEGGWCQNYKRPPQGWGTDRLYPYFKDHRRLHSPQWIRRYVKRDDEAHRLRRFARRVLDRASAVPMDMVRGDICRFEADFTAVKERQRERDRLFRASMALGLDFEDAANLAHGGDKSERALSQVLKRDRSVLKTRRRVLKRAARTAECVVGRDVVSAFARGERAVVMGETAGFAVRARNLHASGHGAVEIDVLSPDQKTLGELCFYIEDTPALDQLTAIALHCAAGCENEIIETANIISVTAAGAGHPLLMKPNPPGIMPGAPIVDAEAVRNSIYVQETGHIWSHALGAHMLGKYLTVTERLVGC